MSEACGCRRLIPAAACPRNALAEASQRIPTHLLTMQPSERFAGLRSERTQIVMSPKQTSASLRQALRAVATPGWPGAFPLHTHFSCCAGPAAGRQAARRHASARPSGRASRRVCVARVCGLGLLSKTPKSKKVPVHKCEQELWTIVQHYW